MIFATLAWLIKLMISSGLLYNKVFQLGEGMLITAPYSSIWTEETKDGVLRVLTRGRTPMYEGRMLSS